MWRYILIFIAVLLIHQSSTNLSCRNRDTAKVRRDDPSRRCRKQCTAHGDCSGANKNCTCDDDCGLSCVNEDAICSEELVLNNGNIEYKYPKGATGTNKTYRTVATYTCNSGHQFFGRRQRTCLSSKEWSHSHMEYNCTRICIIPSGRIGDAIPADYGPFYPGDVMKMKCVLGYLAEDPSLLQRTCQADYTWSVATYTCNVQDCYAPESISGGSYAYMNTKGNLFGGRIRYSCDPGYTFKGSPQTLFACAIRGDADRVAWKEYEDPWPECEKIRCPPPTTPDNGGHDSEDMTNFRYNGVVKYHCDAGYELVGNSSLTCDANGRWGTVPTCQGKFDTRFNNNNHGYTVERGSFTRERYEKDGLVEIMMKGYGTLRSKPITLGSDEKICAKVDFIKASGKEFGDFFADAFADGTSVQLYDFPISLTWKSAYFKLKLVGDNNEIQLQFKALTVVQIDRVDKIDCAEWELHTTTKASTTTPKPTTERTTTTKGTDGEIPDEPTTIPSATSTISPPSPGFATWAIVVIVILALIALGLIVFLVYIKKRKPSSAYSGPSAVTSANSGNKPESTPMSVTVPDNGVQPENVATPV